MAVRAGELVAGAVALQVLGLAGTWGMVQSTADRRWREMASWADAARAEFDRRDVTRAVAWGDARDGAAFAHYARAMELAAPRVAGFPPGFGDGPAVLDAAETAALAADWAASLDALRAGAHCRDARPVRSLTNGCDPRLGRWHEATCLVRAAVVAARHEAAAGEPRRGVGRVLDAATMACDLVRSPWDRVLGGWLLRTLADGCSDAWLATCDCVALDDLAAGLARLDASWPFERAIHDALLVDAHAWLRSRQPDFVAGVWRYAFSRRWMLAASVLDAVRAFGPAADPAADRAGEPSGGVNASWPRRQRWLQGLAAPLAATANPANKADCWRLERAWRTGVAHLRLLRAAVDVHRGLAPPPLDDPLGDGVIAIERVPDGVRLVSGAPLGTDAVVRIVRPR